MADTGDSGTITIRWTIVSRDDDGRPKFDWSVEPSAAALTDDDIEALMTEIASRF